jgi:hypothetical protein
MKSTQFYCEAKIISIHNSDGHRNYLIVDIDTFGCSVQSGFSSVAWIFYQWHFSTYPLGKSRDTAEIETRGKIICDAGMRTRGNQAFVSQCNVI